jgi:hypothetical protein
MKGKQMEPLFLGEIAGQQILPFLWIRFPICDFHNNDPAVDHDRATVELASNGVPNSGSQERTPDMW